MSIIIIKQQTIKFNSLTAHASQFGASYLNFNAMRTKKIVSSHGMIASAREGTGDNGNLITIQSTCEGMRGKL